MTAAHRQSTPRPAGLSEANWQDPPFNRWSFLHLDEVLPTMPLRRGGAPTARFAQAPYPVESIEVHTPQEDRSRSVADVLAATETDAFAVIHRGHLVHESYSPSTDGHQPHLLMSITKSFVGAVAGILIDNGDLDPNIPIESYLPEVRGRGYGGATTRHLLDMRSGILSSEDYLDPHSHVNQLERAASWRPSDGESPYGIYGYLAQMSADRPHGGHFSYRSCETDVLGWVCERATGADMGTLLSTLIWQRLGAEHDGHLVVDSAGATIHDGGLSATARDVARFGELLLNDGRNQAGERVLPVGWVDDTVSGAVDSAAAFVTESAKSGMPAGHYRNQLWVPTSGRPLLLGLGIFGQMLYVNVAAQMVGVKLSSWPVPQSAERFVSTFSAFEAISAELSAPRPTPVLWD